MPGQEGVVIPPNRRPAGFFSNGVSLFILHMSILYGVSSIIVIVSVTDQRVISSDCPMLTLYRMRTGITVFTGPKE